MPLAKLLASLDELPDVVARLASIHAAADELADLGYAGAGALWQELDLALEGLADGAPNALLILEGLRHAKGDAAAFQKWDAGIAGRINMRDLP